MARLIWEAGSNPSLADKSVQEFENVEENEFMVLLEDARCLACKSRFEGTKA